jgi:hypothetical protein
MTRNDPSAGGAGTVLSGCCAKGDLALENSTSEAFRSTVTHLGYGPTMACFGPASAPRLQIEIINNCENDQRNQEPFPHDKAWASRKLSVEFCLA